MLSARANRMAASKYSDTKEDNYTLKGGERHGKQIHTSRGSRKLDVSKPYAYKIIRQLNEELKAKGFITIAGRVNRQYFNERLYGAERKELNASL